MGISDSTKILLIRIILFTSYVLLGAVVFQAIESEEQVREMDAVRSTRMEILTKYNISESDAKRWSKTFLSTSVGSEDFLQWNYGNSFLFAMVVLTTIGKIYNCQDRAKRTTLISNRYLLNVLNIRLHKSFCLQMLIIYRLKQPIFLRLYFRSIHLYFLSSYRDLTINQYEFIFPTLLKF